METDMNEKLEDIILGILLAFFARRQRDKYIKFKMAID